MRIGFEKDLKLLQMIFNSDKIFVRVVACQQ